MTQEHLINLNVWRNKGAMYSLEARGKCRCCGDLILNSNPRCSTCGTRDVLVFSEEDKRLLNTIRYFFKQK